MIELNNVSFTYSAGTEQNGISNVNLKIDDGEVVLLTGVSGCGKTTITRLINGLIPNYYEGKLTGEVIVNGKDVSKSPIYETASEVGSVFQNPRSQFFNVDTTSELVFYCENQGFSEKEIRNRMEHTVSDFKIEPLMGRSIFELSGGEKQKIACASISVANSNIIVLDEPSSNLDASSINDLKQIILSWKRQGKTVVIAEHRLYFLRELVDRMVVMRDGVIVQEYFAQQFKKMEASRLAQMGLRPLKLEDISCNLEMDRENKAKFTILDFSFSYKNDNYGVSIPLIEIPGNSIVAIIGHNGAGKSTFARCLCGLEKSCKGKIKLNEITYSNKERLKNCYMVMQDVNHQLFAESVIDEVLLSMSECLQVSEEENINVTEKILEGLDLLHLKALHPMSLSGGQKQRVAIASAIASKREIVLFDEPTSGLDLEHMNQFAMHLKKLQSIGKTIFVISHDIELILNCCSYVLHMERGSILEQYVLNKKTSEKLKSFFICKGYI